MGKKDLAKETAKKQMDIFSSCKTAEEIVAAAKSHSLELTPEQTNEILSAVLSGGLSDEQLEKVNGGYYCLGGPPY